MTAALRKIEKVPHPLIDGWAKKHFDLELEIRRAIDKMPVDEVQALRHSVSSLTDTNCWFAEYDVKPMIEEILAEKEWRDRLAAEKKARDEQFAAVESSQQESK